MKLNIIPKIFLLIMLTFLMTFVACSSHDRTTTESTEIVSVDSNNGLEERTVSRTSTSSEELDQDNGCGGILSCTVGFVGDVIALPFRAVGALIDIVF